MSIFYRILYKCGTFEILGRVNLIVFYFFNLKLIIMELNFYNEDILTYGDTHGSFQRLNFELHKRFIITQSLIIQVGDFGVGFYNERYYTNEFAKLNKQLAKYGNTLIVIRGNHDNPEWFDGRVNLSNLKLVPDYTVLYTVKGNILCIGGEASIDYKQRTEGEDFWREELPIYNEESLHLLPEISYVITHGMPEVVYPYVKYKCDDKEINEYASLSRKILGRIWAYLSFNQPSIKSWYCGHYHESHSENVLGIDYHILNINELKELK